MGSLFTTFQYGYLFWILARVEWTSPIKIEVFLIWSMGAAIWGTIASVCLIGFLLAVKLLSRWFRQPGGIKNRLLGR